ncbi:hypothetical protein FOZ63_000995 [Perkinsus olseni]|uniref:AP2/ERF domain-containing protein n=1 Tax=Perkinsus olseni TaxID=32597 RepID=A0A7J6NFC8_PEROL|nr:hypothetical protein FOZ63_000995 [Perkinsus olseni]
MRLSPLRYCGKVLRKSDYIKTEGVHQRVFRWGIGNRFRSANANRYQPVHLERIKEVTLNDDYYDSPDPNIRWDDYSECWEVYWYEHEKLNAKPFPVKKFGIKWSKEEAKKFYEELKESGRVHARPSHKGGDDSIMWDERMQGWAVSYWQNGRPRTATYGASKHGFYRAHDKAIEVSRDSQSTYWRREMNDDGWGQQEGQPCQPQP